MADRPTRFKAWQHVANVARDASELTRMGSNLKTRVAVGRAIQEGRVRLAYQPVVKAASTKQIAFWEALVRIRDKNGELLSPGEFLPEISGTSLAVLLDCEVLRLVIDQLASRADLRLSVNVGPDSFAHPEWIRVLEAGLETSPDLALRLIIEITEDVVTSDHPQGAAFLNYLRDAGVSLALDDFGGGATSIRQFRETRFDILKLDGNLCRSLHEDRDTQVLVGAMIGIAQHYEMLTVAEHIDSAEAAAAAARVGIDSLQGYRFGKPSTDIPFKVEKTARRSAG